MSPRVRSRSRALICVSAAAGTAIAVATVAPAHAETTDSAAPKNIIVLISDGAGYNQFDAASLYDAGEARHQIRLDPATGALERVEGAPAQVYDTWPVQVGQSHYSTSGRGSYSPEEAWGSFEWVASGATDSAAAGTALGTGVKTNNGVLGFDPGGERLLTVGEQAMAVGKKVGLVTSVPFNHATPAGFIAHNSNRNDYQGLATEMIDSGIDVIMGGGHPNFTDANTSRASDWTWISDTDFGRVSSGATDFTFVESRAGFESLAAGDDVPEKVFGLAQVGQTLQYNRPGLANNAVLPYTDRANNVPDLPTMTQGALNVLEAGEDGFFLMVEAGAVDWAGHANQTTRVIEEQLDFNAAVETVDAWVAANSSWDETLVIVTADHETGYFAGAGAGPGVGWTPMTGAAGELPQVSWHSGGHTNALVPFYAAGAGSEILQERADRYDWVRGAYLDNTDVGETIFDLLGHSGMSGGDTVAVEASVPAGMPSGALSLSVAGSGATQLTGAGRELGGELPAVTVTDTRSEVQSVGQGWTVSGSAADLRAGNRSIGADQLSWSPEIVSSDAGANPGAPATLGTPALLAEADRVTRVGTTVAGADLLLAVPDDASAGRYGTSITLTLFPQD